MTDLLSIAERDARDRIAELLGLGIAAPLQDLPVSAQPPMVAYAQQGTVKLDYSQQGIGYRLATAPCEAAGDGWSQGTGGELMLATGKMTEDQDFFVCADKDGAVIALCRRVLVQVGVNDELNARIPLDASQGTRLLDPSRYPPYPDTAERLTRYGSKVQVEVDDAQAGVIYTLETGDDNHPTIVSDPVPGGGPGEKITLTTKSPLPEDRVLLVRAKLRTSNQSSGNTASDKDKRLKIQLPLKVMADPSRPVSFDAPTNGEPKAAIAVYGVKLQLVIADSQASATYQVFGRPIPDLEYRPRDAPSARVMTVPIPDPPPTAVPVLLPASFLDWAAPAGFAPIAGPAAGTGGELRIELPAAAADRVLLVQAAKSHTREADGPLPSAVRLASALVQLVRPNPSPNLNVQLAIDGAGQRVTVQGGEPGVFYYLRPAAAAGNEFPTPAYIHKHDPADPTRNKGIGALEVERDLVVAPSWPAGQAPGDPAHTAPLPPVVATSGLKAGGQVWVRAVKAQTRLVQSCADSVTLGA